MPFQVTASLLSSLLGYSVFADSSIPNPDQSTENSQNMDLLQANVSLALTTEDKTKKGITGEIDITANVNILSDNALLPATGPMDAYGGADYDPSSEEDISIYVVHRGDTVQVVADLFDVSPDTIYSANDLTKESKLKEGDVLLILPFSGVEHTVAKGETLQGIANKYKVSLNDILSANDLEDGAKLAVGERLMIPGGDMPSVSRPSGTVARGGYSNVPLTAGYFVNPVPGARKSRGIKPGHRGVDLAAPTGTPIHAAAEGVVLIARNGWNGGYGNFVAIRHPNGVESLYAHMSRLGTTAGARVSQGEVIGYVGSTGHSTGPHLHFQVKGAKNPF